MQDECKKHIANRERIKDLSNKAEGIFQYVGSDNVLFRLIHQKKEKKKVSTVQIFDADLRFVNEIPMPNTLAGIQYADQLAAENPGRLYVVMDEHRQKVYQR